MSGIQPTPTKTILCFDDWTKGAPHYERLAGAFRDRGLELLVLHIGSWGNDPGRPREEMIGNIRYRDISYYGGKGFGAALRQEQPDAVVFLSVLQFANRAFNRHCRQQGIPTMHLFHGVHGVQPTHTGTMFKTSLVSRALFVLGKIPKALRHIWPCYAQALWETRAAPAEWLRFGSDIFRYAIGRFPKAAAEDERTDGLCALHPADVKYGMDKYRLETAQVVTVGLPDLARFGLTQELAGHHLKAGTGGADVMYVETGYFFVGGVFASLHEAAQHIRETNRQLASAGRRLVFKARLDYWQGSEAILDALRAEGVEICTNEQFVPRLKNCGAAIVETSSAALIPELMGLPVFLAKYGKLAGQEFGTLLTSYPRSQFLTALPEFESQFAAERAAHQPERTRRWIAENTGPLPAEAMPQRVAAAVANLAGRRG